MSIRIGNRRFRRSDPTANRYGYDPKKMLDELQEGDARMQEQIDNGEVILYGEHKTNSLRFRERRG